MSNTQTKVLKGGDFQTNFSEGVEGALFGASVISGMAKGHLQATVAQGNSAV
jgi:hypothetical protein